MVCLPSSSSAAPHRCAVPSACWWWMSFIVFCCCSGCCCVAAAAVNGVTFGGLSYPGSPDGLRWAVRLRGSAAFAGLVEVRAAGSGAPWGTLCTSASPIGAYAPVAICRSAGFLNATNATEVTVEAYRSVLITSIPITMQLTACGSSATFLDNCSLIVPPAPLSCSRSGDLTINCFPANAGNTAGTSASTISRLNNNNVYFPNAPLLPPPSLNATLDSATADAADGIRTWDYRVDDGTSRLEVRPSPVSPWGFVCRVGFGATEADVACRSVGYLRAASFTTTIVAPTVPVFYYMFSVVCPAGLVNRTHFGPVNHTLHSACTYRYATEYIYPATCASSTTVGLTCTNEPDYGPNGHWQVRLVDPATLNASAAVGVLQVRPNATAPWGIVCNDGFSLSAAAAACRSAGFSVYYSYGTATGAQRAAVGVTASTLIYMDDVRCSVGSYLPQCTFLFSDAGNTRHNCIDAEAVFVTCIRNTSSGTNDGTSSFTSGRQPTVIDADVARAAGIAISVVVGIGIIVYVVRYLNRRNGTDTGTTTAADSPPPPSEQAPPTSGMFAHQQQQRPPMQQQYVYPTAQQQQAQQYPHMWAQPVAAFPTQPGPQAVAPPLAGQPYGVPLWAAAAPPWAQQHQQQGFAPRPTIPGVVASPAAPPPPDPYLHHYPPAPSGMPPTNVV